MYIRIVLPVLVGLLSLSGCTASSSRITDYLSGVQPPAGELRTVPLPLIAGLVVVLPENEAGKRTTPSNDVIEKLAQRVRKELQISPAIVVERVFPPVIIAGSGLAGMGLDRLRQLTQGTNLTRVIVVVPTSMSASKIRFTNLVETQLFARMDAALVDLSNGRVLATESGEDDYVLGETLYYSDGVFYPRLYYRTFSFSGPFTVVQGDPYKALGEAAFGAAADQLGMKLRVRLNPAA
jgi:hypothetical protein